jgi:hypothetical protein
VRPVGFEEARRKRRRAGVTAVATQAVGEGGGVGNAAEGT